MKIVKSNTQYDPNLLKIPGTHFVLSFESLVQLVGQVAAVLTAALTSPPTIATAEDRKAKSFILIIIIKYYYSRSYQKLMKI